MLSNRPPKSIPKLSEDAKNICLYSEDFLELSNPAWTNANNASITPSVIDDPFGFKTATLFSGGDLLDLNRQSINVESGRQYCFSIYIKDYRESPVSTYYTSIILACYGDAYGGSGYNDGGWAEFSLQNKVIESSGGSIPLDDMNIVDAENGWLRLDVVFTAQSNNDVIIGFSYLDNFGSYDQDSYYAWGAQLQTGSSPTGQIKTLGTPASSTVNLVPVTPVFEKYPNSHARIGYRNKLAAGGYTVTTGNLVDGFSGAGNFVNATTYQTWERWSEILTGSTGSTTGGCEIDFDTPQLIGYIGITAHNFFTVLNEASLGVFNVDISFYNGVDFIEQVVFSTSPTSQTKQLTETIFYALENSETPIDRVTVYYRVTDTIATTVGVLSIGDLLVMEQPIYGGHSPAELSDDVVYTNTKSANGNFIGRTIESQSYKTKYDWRNLTADWYRSTFQPFVEHAKEKPFFIQWRPDYHPDEAIFCWTQKSIKPKNQGGGNTRMMVSIDVEGFNGV